MADAVTSTISGLAAPQIEGVRMGNEGIRIPNDCSLTVGEPFGRLAPSANPEKMANWQM